MISFRDELGRLTEPQRDEEAERAVSEAMAYGRGKQYAALVHGLPMLLHQHGLGQTLAYLQARSSDRDDSPYQLLYEHLCDWLDIVLEGTETDFLTYLTKSDSQVYLLAAEEAHHFVIALQKALIAYETGGGSDQ